MKRILLLTLSMLLSLNSLAAPAVQRTLDSSYQDYQKYLEKSKQSSFVDAYIQLSSVMEQETPLLENCLEEVYTGAPNSGTCFNAVKALTAKPLNQSRREILYSFLQKLKKGKSAQRGLYEDLQRGLLRTHPQLAKTFHEPVPASGESEKDIQDLEMSAWKKAVSRKFPLEEIALLINGRRVSKLEKWKAPEGVYQWSLVTNTHEPLVRLGTFSQFAAESLKDLRPLASVACQDLPNLEAEKFGLLQVEVFANAKCVAQFGVSIPIPKQEHLGNSEKMVQIEKSNSQSWIWPALVFVTVGIAAGLKDKKVSVEMPGSQ